MVQSSRSYFAVLVSALLLAPPSLAFLTPLPDQAVREAYFLGQRHDGTYPRLLQKYTKFLPPPKTGPYISFIAFYTPFIQIVQFNDRLVRNYSAQQAEIDHRNQPEFVRVVIQIQLTSSYPATMEDPAGRRNGSSPLLISRPHDFWKNFEVQVYDGEKPILPSASFSHANSSCGRSGPCVLIGATLDLQFSAGAFASNSATIDVTPPEGDPVSVDFDLDALR